MTTISFHLNHEQIIRICTDKKCNKSEIGKLLKQSCINPQNNTSEIIPEKYFDSHFESLKNYLITLKPLEMQRLGIQKTDIILIS